MMCMRGAGRYANRLRAIIAATLMVTAVATNTAAAASPTKAGAAAGAVVRIGNFAFAPAVLTVPAGTTVTWRNQDDIPHTVADKTLSFRSKPLDTDDYFAHTFSSPGRYEYFCSLHPHMVGTVIVEPAAPRS